MPALHEALRVGMAVLCAGYALTAYAADLPSFLQAGDAFCTDQADFDAFALGGQIRPGAAVQTCQTVDRPTRVAVLTGRGGIKSEVLVLNGPDAYQVGWTNGTLPLAR